MSRLSLPLSSLLLTVWLLGDGVTAGAEVARLGSSPLCEASALVRLPGDADDWLVADNEHPSRLFAFQEKDGTLEPVPERDVLLDDAGPSDIEALAASTDELFVVGSHGRKKSCRAGKAPARRRLLRLSPGESSGSWHTVSGARAIDALQSSDATVSSCLEALFGGREAENANLVCTTLIEAEQSASPERCKTLNIEAAVIAPDADGDGRLWLGLRDPRVGESAILLRVAKATGELRFDAVQLLDTGGRGLRALDVSEESLFGIAAGETAPGILFRSALPAPGGSGPVETLVAGLPSGAEGLGMSALERRAWIVTDGSSGKQGSTRCKIPAGQLQISW